MNLFFKILSSSTLLLALAGCGDESTSNTSQITMVPVFFQLQENQSQFNLLGKASYDSYSGVINGCKSGYSKAIDDKSVDIKVQNKDVDCVFSLNKLVLKGESFTDYSQAVWKKGSQFSIIGNKGSELVINVLDNLSSPISGTQLVSLAFNYAVMASNQTVGANIGSGISISGTNEIDLDVKAINVSVDSKDGAGLFQVDLQCSTPVEGSGLKALCNSVLLSGLKYNLVKDDYAGANLSLAQCKDIALKSPQSGTVVDAGTTNGGILTSFIKGPVRLFDVNNANLIFAITNNVSDVSCKYFRVQVLQP